MITNNTFLLTAIFSDNIGIDSYDILMKLFSKNSLYDVREPLLESLYD